jgi:type II secretory pathway component GspD/PulD (secretin)
MLRRRTLICFFFLLISSLAAFTAFAAGDTVSLSLEDAEFAQIFQTLGRLQNLNVVVDPAVVGRGTLDLKDVPFGEALDLVAGLGGYEYRILGNTLIVGTPERLRYMDGADVETIHFIETEYASAEDLERALSLVLPRENIFIQPDSGLVILIGPQEIIGRAEAIIAAVDKPQSKSVTTVPVAVPTGEVAPVPEAPSYQVKVYRLNYADPEMTRAALSLILDDSRMRIDHDSKGIIVRATEAEHGEIAAFLADFDKPIAQVVLEVWVQEMTADALQNLGIDFRGVPNFTESTAPVFLELEWQAWDLIMALRILEEQGDAKLLANPKITTISGQTASIFVGDRVPIVLTDEEGRNTLEFLESGINLKVTPRISDDEYVTILVEPEVSTFIWRADTAYPQIRTREAQTNVRVKSGQPFVLGGLLQEQENEAIKRIPFLSQLPILGKLFQWKETKHMQTEMTIFLIPRIVTHDEEGVSYTDFFPKAQ